jgi:glycosyltransferase involved in cell wall biosynthesis
VYDLIPILASEYVPDDTVAGFADYLSVVKFSDCVSAISASTAVEFTSYSGAMVSQGFIGPSVTTQPLPLVEAPPSSVDGTLAARAIMTDPRLPLVLCVASISPHKNQSTLLEAAIRLHADGVRVELVFVAPNAWNVGAFRARMDEAVAMGMHVQLVNELSDETLWALYRRARCVALISRVEGYGLPIVEAISVGTPVLASNFGSMAEIAKDGGVLTVDPWDMAAVTASLGSLVTDDDLHAQLSAEARGRARGTWDDYARQTWHALVDHQDVPTEGSL